MGNFLTRVQDGWMALADVLGRRQEARILMLGLDAAGKTSILYKVKRKKRRKRERKKK
jgi:GTPase SAR1 family protein